MKQWWERLFLSFVDKLNFFRFQNFIKILWRERNFIKSKINKFLVKDIKSIWNTSRCKPKTKHPSTSRNWPRLWINTSIWLRKIKCMSLLKKFSSCLIANSNLKNLRKPSSYFCVVSKDSSLFSPLKTMRPSVFWTICSSFTKAIQTCGIWKKEVTFYLTQIKFTRCSTSSKWTENTSTTLGFWRHSKTSPSQKIYFSIWSGITWRETISQKLNLMCWNLILDL